MNVQMICHILQQKLKHNRTVGLHMSNSLRIRVKKACNFRAGPNFSDRRDTRSLRRSNKRAMPSTWLSSKNLAVWLKPSASKKTNTSWADHSLILLESEHNGFGLHLTRCLSSQLIQAMKLCFISEEEFWSKSARKFGLVRHFLLLSTTSGAKTGEVTTGTVWLVETTSSLMLVLPVVCNTFS